MESTGEGKNVLNTKRPTGNLQFLISIAMKVHVSENTKVLLDEFGGFILEKRGTVEIKVLKYFMQLNRAFA